MKYSLLFRKLEISKKTYYQLYDIKEDFEITDNFADYDHRQEKDCFYVEIDSKDISKSEFTKYMVYCENNDKFSDISDPNEMAIVMKEFCKVYHDFKYIIKRETVDDIVKSIKKEVLFQDAAIKEVLDIIFTNQELLNIDISEQEKIALKDNIILFGPKGNGKNSIINALKSHLIIPHADIYLTPDTNTNATNILTQLVSTARGDSIEHGIVFIRDNFDQLADYSDELAYEPMLPLKKLFNLRAYIGDDKHLVDFRKLTFVTAMNASSLEELKDLGLDGFILDECQGIVFVPPLTIQEKKEILLKSVNSRLLTYRKILKRKGKRLLVSKDALNYLVTATDKLNLGMDIINHIIDFIVKDEWDDSKDTVYVTSSKVREYLDSLFDLDTEKDKEKVSISSEIFKKESNDLDRLVEEVKKSVRAQDEQVRRILFTILRNKKQADNKNINNPKKYIKNILLRGESGTGKTLILSIIARLLDLPIYTADATRYTEAGFKGDDVENMLVDLYHTANDNLKEAEKGILIIDEIDKKAAIQSDQTDASRGAVLNALLKIVEGTKIPINIGSKSFEKNIMFNTERLTVICSGAFEGIEKIRDKRLGIKKTVGFGAKEEVTNLNQDPNIIDEDYVEYGMMRQFVARFGLVVNLNSLTPESLKDIIKNSDLSELSIQKELFKDENIELVYNDDFCDELAKCAYNKKIGARGIEKAFQDVLSRIKIENIDCKQYEKVVFTKECISDPDKIILVPREKDKVKVKKMVR